MRIRSILFVLLCVLACVPAASAGSQAVGRSRAAAAEHTVTLLNQTDARVWIGSSVQPDGSAPITGLPVLDPGGSATVTVPENSDAGHWRGRLFARQGCEGEDGSFHCALGDCGPYIDHCTVEEQPVSLAEFNFDPADAQAPWYNVSYVNAVSVPVTITPDGVEVPPDGGGECARMGCPEDLLPYCPPEDLTTDPATGEPVLCVNPNRDATTPYSDAINAHCPYAYAWSKNDQVPGNQVVRNCRACSGFTVTFH